LFAVKRNTLVLTLVLFIFATFAWAGWANFEYRKQAAERLLAQAARGELVVDAAGTPEYVSPLKGKPAPAFSLENLDGKKVSLADYKGKAVLVNFWATWCAPCKIETPWLVELRDQYAAQGFEILGVSTEGDGVGKDDKAAWDKDKLAIAHSAQQMHMQYPVLIDGDSIADQYGGLDELPMSFFVDRNGTVVEVQMGLTSKANIEGDIKKTLGN
jgi:cytochrome c biogenesis protein CcmG/thiol:disulfide interchange protein DsbE